MENKTYEEAYARLEEILNLMNSGKVPLDAAVSLYKEADALTRFCQNKLQEAESTLETLLRDKEGKLMTDENGEPLTQDFTPSRVSL